MAKGDFMDAEIYASMLDDQNPNSNQNCKK